MELCTLGQHVPFGSTNDLPSSDKELKRESISVKCTKPENVLNINDVMCCTHKNSNGPNSFRPKQKRPAESSILPATLILDKKQEKSNIVNKKSKKGSTPKAETNNKNPAKHAFAGLAIDEPEIVATDKTAQVADLSLKIKPVMLMYNKNLVLLQKN
ncbi:hypothetical protein TNIN_104761 [Trichonephila inaurata madagascariensis]|uniref:Uncharacterized protein n=1 Tax=Trichonephila inaurata madagascariensis TaxID=2747483 RepID=A0A8X7BZN3_9ARAC|nr:hypothetical protein TNIN_104761 [Trichonephila inaurata madagascariensis]